GTDRTTGPSPVLASKSCPSTTPVLERSPHAWSVHGRAVGRGCGLDAGPAHAGAAPAESSTHWQYRPAHRRASVRCERAATQPSAVHWPLSGCARPPRNSARGLAWVARLVVADRPASGLRSTSNAAAFAR